jgi:uncharacterized pyridoxamine 5'-phosphate oxidase family protein
MEDKYWSMFKSMQMAHLATCEGDQPRLRPITLVCIDQRFYFATGAADQKSAQIALNPKVEFCSLIQAEPYTGYFRGSGILHQIDDVQVKKAVADVATYIYNYWQDAADPAYRLYELELTVLKYMHPGESVEQAVEL